jgi:Ca-activated chloride channel homolog
MRITGILNGKEVKYDFAVDNAEKFPAIEKIYAREKINDIMYDIVKTRNESYLKKDVIRIALEHQLVTKYTSRVAVEYELQTEKLPTGKLRTVKVPVELPKGWDPQAFHATATNNVLLMLIGFSIFFIAFVIKFLVK